jgi:hypothetical protein
MPQQGATRTTKNRCDGCGVCRAHCEATHHDTTCCIGAMRDSARCLLKQRPGWKLSIGMDSYTTAGRNVAEAFRRP